MNRILRGAVLLALSAALGACGTEPDQFADGTPDHIVAEPGVVFISRTDSQNVRIRVVDQQGTSLLMPISISGVGAGINVRPDSAFRPIFRGDTMVFNPNTTELRVWVSTSELDNSEFTVTSGDLTLKIPVVVTPNDFESFPFSTIAPALGEVVTATVTSDLLFTDSTKVLFGDKTLTPVSIAADGSSLTFNAGPDLLGPASFSNVTLTYNKNVVFTVQAADTLNSPSSTQAFTFSNLAPGIGESITVTPPAGIVFTAGTKVTFDSLGPVPHYTVAGDGSSIAMVAGPNSVGPTTFTNVANPANPSFTFTLKSADTLKSAGVSVFEATADKANAAANEPVTFTGSSSNYKFDVFNSLLFVNGTPALLSSVTADSSSAVVLPRPGTTGGSSYLLSPLVAGFLLDSLPISGNGPTVAALGASQAGTDDFGTAPTINAPGVGEAVAFWDGAPYGHTSAAALGSASDRLYKLVVPADGSFRFALPYISDGSDLGIYFYRDDATHSLITSFFADDLGAGGAESADIDLDAGTYYMAVVHFHYTTAASLFGLNIIGLEPEE